MASEVYQFEVETEENKLLLHQKNDAVVPLDKSKRDQRQEEGNLYLKLLQYATPWELCLTIVGLVLSVIVAFVIPYNIVLYGEFMENLFTNTVINSTRDASKHVVLPIFGGSKNININSTADERRSALIHDTVAYGIGSLFGCFMHLIFHSIAFNLINFSAIRQISRIRSLLLRALLHQDLEWYDLCKGTNFASQITSNLENIKEQVIDKMAIVAYLIATFLSCVMFSLAYSWTLSFFILASIPFIFVGSIVFSRMRNALLAAEAKHYHLSDLITRETVNSIRAVVEFGGEKRESERFSHSLIYVSKARRLIGMYSGLASGLMWFFLYCCYAAALWYGIEFVLDDSEQSIKEFSALILIIVLFAGNIRFLTVNLPKIVAAQSTSNMIFEIIDRTPKIDSHSIRGLKPLQFLGNIEYKNIHFHYPMSQNLKTLQGLNLSIRAGQTVALVGNPGCGKSTCLKLLQRFYDPIEGEMYIDGFKLNEMNVSWVRSFIGIADSDAILFSTTVAENIRYGKPDATQHEIETAAQIANCHTFIKKLPKSYETMLMDGGQKLPLSHRQRIAIARAIVKNPTILLLDNATSALDEKSEQSIFEALRKSPKSRTTIVVSNCLTTLKKVDRIFFIDDGRIVEEGTPTDLFQWKGYFYNFENSEKQAQYCLQNKSGFNEGHQNEKDEAEIENTSEEEIDVSENNLFENNTISWIRIIKLNLPDWFFIMFGYILTIVLGFSMPAFAIIISVYFEIIISQNHVELNSKSFTLTTLLVVLGIFTCLGTLMRSYLFTVAAARLTKRMREKTFNAILNQEIGWFDNPKHTVEELCNRLDKCCDKFPEILRSKTGFILKCATTVFINVGISVYFSWKLSLVGFVSIPIILISYYYYTKYDTLSSLREKEILKNCYKMSNEAILNIKTVASLVQEPYILNRYNNEILRAKWLCYEKARFRGLLFALTQVAPILGYVIAMCVGAILVAYDEVQYKNVMKISGILLFSAILLAQSSSYTCKQNEVFTSVGTVLQLLDRKPQYVSPIISQETSIKIKGNISFSKVHFTYPNRQNVEVLKGFDLCIENGQHVALVGPSGIGKTTCAQLLLRYYDPDSGRIRLDGTCTTDYPLQALHSQIAIISNQPILFNRTILENIAYGDNSREVSQCEIIDAAKKADIHEFISSLPIGYRTVLGTNEDNLLSLEQKLRLSIARVWIKNPSILILDDATAFLDQDCERHVQKSLVLAMHGRTCLEITRNVCNLHSATFICVLQDGIVVEQGTHIELMAKNGIFKNLYKKQKLVYDNIKIPVLTQ